MIVNIIDSILTIIFYLPAKLIGYEKCSKCTVRVRWFQFLLLVSLPIARLSRIRKSRLDWDLRVNPPGKVPLKLVNLQEL